MPLTPAFNPVESAASQINPPVSIPELMANNRLKMAAVCTRIFKTRMRFGMVALSMLLAFLLTGNNKSMMTRKPSVKTRFDPVHQPPDVLPKMTNNPGIKLGKYLSAFNLMKLSGYELQVTNLGIGAVN